MTTPKEKEMKRLLILAMQKLRKLQDEINKEFDDLEKLYEDIRRML